MTKDSRDYEDKTACEKELAELAAEKQQLFQNFSGAYNEAIANANQVTASYFDAVNKELEKSEAEIKDYEQKIEALKRENDFREAQNQNALKLVQDAMKLAQGGSPFGG